MKWLAFSVICMLFLVACADEELPPTPPPPGGEAAAGRATAGILSLDPKVLPKWALPLEKNVEVTFTDKEIIVKAKRPADAHKNARAFLLARSYVFGIPPYTAWVENRAIPGSSGKLAADIWNVDYAEYRALLSLFKPGQNYFVIFYCYEDIDGKTGKPKRDSKGYIVWKACDKYHLGGFEIGGSYPDILIEKIIENEFYKGSAKATVADGTAYTATYEDRYNKVKTTVTVTKLNNVEEYKKSQALNIAGLEPLWTKNGNVCGFQTPGGQTSFWWISGTWKIEVITFANTIASDKIGNYGVKYASDCDLLNKLKNIAKGGANVCGNNKAEAGEQCDNAADSACPGACKPDCTCAWIGLPNTGVCGDYVIQKPNSLNIIEQCELPGKRDLITGQLIASSCFVRDSSGKITSVGACDDKCQCDPNVKVAVPACGNGKADPGEQCGDPGTGLCKKTEVCKNCGCIPIPQGCVHNKKIDGTEKCDPTATPTGCAFSEVCSPTCVCAKAMAKCGNGQPDFGEQCGEPGLNCPVIPGLFGACIGCNCWYFFFPWPPGGCSKLAGDECAADIDCANPPGGTVSPLCNAATCKCYNVCGDTEITSPNDDGKNEECDPPGSKCKDGSTCSSDCKCGASNCPNNVVDWPAEDCDPPGAPSCIMALPGGGCAIAFCQADCKCPQGERCPEDCPGKRCPVLIETELVQLTLTSGGTIPWNSPGFGTYYPDCGTHTGCVADVIQSAQVIDGSCYQQTGLTAISSNAAFTTVNAGISSSPTPRPTQSPSPAPSAIITHQITRYISTCVNQNTLKKWVVSDGKCVEQTTQCQTNTICQAVTAEPKMAACISSSPPPTTSPRPTSTTVISSPGVSDTVASDLPFTGDAVRMTSETVNSPGVQVVLFVIASLAILLVTLMNFVHTDK